MEKIEYIKVGVHNGVLHLCIDRPEKRNALTMVMFTAITEALKDGDQRDDVRSIVVTGNGSIFCAGHDLKAFEEWPQQPHDPVPTFLHAITEVKKPVVIAAHGSAAGIGVTWLLHADWAVTSAETTFKLPFVDLGIAPEAASTLLLARAVGLPRAKRLLFGGETFTGAEAYQWGLVAELVSPDQVRERAIERASLFALKDSVTLQRIKNWLHPTDECLKRVDEEVAEINAAIARRRQ